jgi:hypothetical protein
MTSVRLPSFPRTHTSASPPPHPPRTPTHTLLAQEKRISCAEALRHPWFSEQPLPKDTALMPTFPATNDSVQARHAAQRRHVAAAAAGR